MKFRSFLRYLDLRWFRGLKLRPTRPILNRRLQPLSVELLETRTVPSTAPTILKTLTTPLDGSSVSSPSPTIQIVFSEKMDSTAGSDTTNYSLFGSSGNAVPINSVTLNYDPISGHESATLNFNGGANLILDTYTVFVRADQLVADSALGGLPIAPPGQYVVANGGRNNISTVNMAGDGTLGSLSDYGLPQGSTSVAATPIAAVIGDLTGTGGLPSLAVVDSANAQVDIFAGQTGASGGGFDLNPDLILNLPASAANKDNSIVLGDFNKDGNLDIAVANFGTNNVTVFLNTTSAGNLSFASGVNFNGGGLLFSPTSLVTGDFDLDGNLDLAVVNNAVDGSDNYNLVILPGNGSGSFGAGTAIGLGNSTASSGILGLHYIATGQLDRDKNSLPDLVVAADTNGADVLLNTSGGAGKFTFASQTLTSSTLANIAVGLVRSPVVGTASQLDIVGLDATNKQVDIWQNAGVNATGSATFTLQTPITVGTNPRGLTLAPIVSGDTRNDILVTQDNAAGTLTVLQNNSSIGSTTFSAVLNSPYSTDNNPSAVVAADTNQDGELDVITLNRTSGDISLFQGIGDGTLETANNIAIGPTTTVSVAVGDLNGDGIPDLVVANNNGQSSKTFVSVLMGQASGGYAAPINISPSATGQSIRTIVSVAIGDVTGDGRPDILVLDQQDATIGVLANNISSSTATVTTGSFIADSQIGLSTGGFFGGIQVANPTQLVLAPFTANSRANGVDDILVSSTGGGGGGHHGGGTAGNIVFLPNTVTPKANQTTYSFGSESKIQDNVAATAVAAADFNGDGNLDFVDVYTNNNTGYATVWLGNGKGTFTQQGSAITLDVANPVGIATADLNGDSYVDFVVVSQTTSQTAGGVDAVLNNFGTGFASPIQTQVLPGTSLQSMVVANVNQDDFPDIIVTTQPGKNGSTTDNVFTLLGIGDGSFQRAIPYLIGGTSTPSLAPSYGAVVSDPYLRVTTFRSGGTTVQANLVTNGTFEARDLTGVPGSLLGWNQYELPDNPGGSHGAWSIQTGNTSPLSGTSVTPPSGLFQAMLDEQNLQPISGGKNNNANSTYAGTTALYQDITIPSNATVVTLSLTVSIYNTTSNTTPFTDNTTPQILDYRTSSANQQVRVDLIDPTASILTIDSTAGLLQSIYVTGTSDKATETLNISISKGNIIVNGKVVGTADLTKFVGKTIRLRIATTNNQGLLLVGVDNVKLNATFQDKTAPVLTNLALRNPGFLDPTTGAASHTTDPTFVGQVSSIGGIGNISYVEVDPGNSSFAGTGIIKITKIDPNGNFTFTLPAPNTGLNTINVSAVDAAGNISPITNFTFFYQGPSLTDWQAFGPDAISTTGQGINYTTVSGNVTAVATDPTDPSGNTYYVGSDNGGVWKTTDGGNDWTPLTDYVSDSNGNPIPVPVGALAVSKSLDTTTNTHVVYVGTGYANLNPDARSGFGVLISTDGGQSWHVDGNSGTVLAGARITSVVVDNSDPNIVYAAVASGGTSGPGVYRSVNAEDFNNATWSYMTSDSVMFGTGGTALASGTKLMSVTSLIEDPFNTNRLLMGIGDIGLTSSGSGNSEGVWLSINKGQSWTLELGGDNSIAKSTLPSGQAGNSLGRVIVAMGAGRVGDEANVFVLIGTPPTSNAAPSFDYGSEYSSGNNGSGLYYSSNNMLNFTEVMLNVNTGGNNGTQNFKPINVFGNNAANSGALLVDPTNPHVVYIGGSIRDVATPSNQDQSFIRVDVGNIDGIGAQNNGDDLTKYNQGTTGNAGGVSYYDGATATNAYAGEGVYWYNLAQATSGNNGKVQLLPPSINALAFDAQGRLLIGTDSGIWRGVSQGYGYDFTSGGSGIVRTGKGQSNFSAPGMSLTALNGNLQISDLTSVVIDPSTRGVLYTTMYTTGTAGSSGVLNWASQGLTGPTVGGNNLGINTAGSVLISIPPTGAPAGTPNTLYRVWEYANSSALVPEVSQDNGATFNALSSTGIPVTGQSAGNFPAFVIDPVQIFDSGLFESELLLGTNRVFITRTSTNVWDALPSIPNLTGTISALAISQSTDGVFYVGSSTGQVFITVNSGADSWPEVDTGLPTNVPVNSITVDPSNYQIVFVTYGGTGASHVFKSANGGQSWTDITSNLPNVSANALVIVPQTVTGVTTNLLYVATDVGVYISSNLGASWSRVGGNTLPNVPVVNLQYNASFGTIAAATQGRGVFTLSTQTDGPHVTNLVNGSSTTTISSINITFSEPINTTTFNASQVKVFGPGGASDTIAVTGLTNIDTTGQDEIFQVTFAPRSVNGFYSVSFGPNVADQVGNLMDQNQNGINGENPGDVFTGRVLFQPGTNHAPVLGGSSATFPATNQDNIGGNSGTDLASWVASSVTITDVDTGAVKGIAITSVDDTNGTWQYSQDSGATWNNITGVSEKNALLLQASSNNRLRFFPASGYIGNAAFAFRAWDLTSGLLQPGGLDGGFGDTTSNGFITPSSAFSGAELNATIQVRFTNHAPSFTPGPDQTSLENGGFQTVASWATNISPGPANESSQTVTFIVTNNNNTLFAVQPAISSSGTLTYQAAQNANGSATVTVFLQDNGGTANGGQDTAGPFTFVINVTPVNQAPFFTGGPSQAPVVYGSLVTVPNWATSISPGAANESGQALTFVVSNDNTTLFVVQPSISPNGTLTYQAGNTIGTANVTVFLQDNGGTANSGQNTSSAYTFTITVSPVVTSGSADAVWVAQMYRDLLKREITQSEVNFWTNALNNGASRQDVANQITNSDEYHTAYLQTLFSTYLGRNLDQTGINVFLPEFHNGETPNQIKAEILSSPEYYKRNGSTTFGYLFGLYRDVLGGPLDDGGRTYWGGKIAGGMSLHDVAMGILTSPSGEARVVKSTYTLMLGRQATDGDVAFWSGMRDEVMQADIAASPEYGSHSSARFYNSGPDTKWLNQVFLDTLGRPIDNIGTTYYINKVRNGVRHPDVIAEIVSSQEFRGKTVTADFINILNRQPDAGTVSYFVNILNKGATFEQVQAMMLGSAEYFSNAGGTNDGFLNALYNTVLHRPLDQTGRDAWGPQLSQGVISPNIISDPNVDPVRESVALGVLTSGEAFTNLVNAGYLKYLRRTSESGGQQYWVAKLQQGLTDELFYTNLLGSLEYYTKYSS